MNNNDKPKPKPTPPPKPVIKPTGREIFTDQKPKP
jgi:hypothetical protein